MTAIKKIDMQRNYSNLCCTSDSIPTSVLSQKMRGIRVLPVYQQLCLQMWLVIVNVKTGPPTKAVSGLYSCQVYYNVVI